MVTYYQQKIELMKPIKAAFTIEKVTSLSEIPNYWSKQDYFELLKSFDVPVANTLSEEECIEYLQMAVSEVKPNEAAQIMLTYKLSASLNEHQIEQISNDMLIDKISEEYPEIDLHCDLYSINQLLYKLYNGKFPNAKAISIEILAEIEDNTEILTKEQILKYLMHMVSDRSIIKRLFSDKLAHDVPFEEAESIIWKLDHENNRYTLYTSEYWIADVEIIKSKIVTEFVG
jgi:hypothetical protein